MKLGALIILLLLSAAPAHANSFSLSAEEPAGLIALSHEIEDRLPKRIKEEVGQSWTLRFVEKETFPIGKLARLKKSDGVIELNAAFSDLPGEQEALQKAAIIHEFALAYDNLPFDPSEISWAQGECLSAEPGSAIEKRCARAKQRTGRISDRPDFLALTGFTRAMLGFNSKQKAPRPAGALNRIDEKEYATPRALFAAALTKAVLDPDFACTRPALYHFLKHELGIDSRSDCPVAKQSDSELNAIDPSRVFRIDVVFASPGVDLLERWGHVMLRVAVCSPLRSQPGPDCLKDTPHHIIYSFNGDGRDDSGLLAGLTGQVSARLFVMPLKNALSYYRSRHRQMDAYPLVLSSLEQERLLAILHEMHLYYEGSWNDLTNNCVTHTLTALTSLQDKNRFTFDNAPQTPQVLVELLVKAALVGPREPVTFLSR